MKGYRKQLDKQSVLWEFFVCVLLLCNTRHDEGAGRGDRSESGDSSADDDHGDELQGSHAADARSKSAGCRDQRREHNAESGAEEGHEACGDRHDRCGCFRSHHRFQTIDHDVDAAGDRDDVHQDTDTENHDDDIPRDHFECSLFITASENDKDGADSKTGKSDIPGEEQGADGESGKSC